MLYGLTIKVYADPRYNEWIMREVRLGMEKGNNLVPYLNTHNHNQLHQIRLGMESGVNYHIYEDVRFKQAQMAELLKGLQEGIEVSDYADFTLSIESMRKRRADLMKKKMEQERKAIIYDDI